MDTITICDLEVRFRVGVTEQERAQPQLLLLTVAIETDLSDAAATDDLSRTIDYDAVCQRLRRLGDGAQWALIEKVAVDVACLILTAFPASAVRVEVKKFIIPQTRFVSVEVTRRR